MKEGSTEAPIRYPLDWHSEEFYDRAALDEEARRQFDVCHGCRRCFNLCDLCVLCGELSDPVMKSLGKAPDPFPPANASRRQAEQECGRRFWDHELERLAWVYIEQQRVVYSCRIELLGLQGKWLEHDLPAAQGLGYYGEAIKGTVAGNASGSV